MLRYLIQRTLGLLPTLFVIVSLSFLILRLAPGGPFDQEQTLPPEIMANLESAYGLDQPIWVRAYIGETDLGRVHPGKKVEIFTDTRPKNAYHGKVGYVSPEAEFTPKSVGWQD